jgi:hypothetical protein
MIPSFIPMRRAAAAAAFALAAAGCAPMAPHAGAGQGAHAAHASHGGHGSHRGHEAGVPYAGQQDRAVRSLSAEEARDIAEGRGMGLARPAELASHPGPMHVLELARELGLDDEQLARTRALITPMREAAIAHGMRWLAAERDIDRLFTTRTATPEALRRALEDSAQAQAAVRAAHLEAHVAQTAILTPAQVARYDALRGYAPAAPQGGR